MTQTQEILQHLKAGKTITPLDALELYGCFRLAARINDLRTLGHRIETRERRLGNGKSVAEYVLAEEVGA